LTDVDAISLSMANLATADGESLKIAARTIVVAVLSNTLAKTGMAVFLGTAALRRTLLLATLFFLIAVAAVAIIVSRASSMLMQLRGGSDGLKKSARGCLLLEGGYGHAGRINRCFGKIAANKNSWNAAKG